MQSPVPSSSPRRATSEGRLTAARARRHTRRYQVQGLLASGGMGSVYRAIDTQTGTVRALKRIRPDQRASRRALEAFAREYQVLAGLSHPRIIEVFDYGLDDEGPYYVMELLEGQDLYVDAALSIEQCCSYMRDVATSLALLHTRKLVHRDLTPGNVRVTEGGHCKVLDFGALTAFGPTWDLVGTPPYLAPETLSTGFLDQGTDLFALGALGYWMLTRRNAFAALTVDDLPALWKLPPNPPSAFRDDVPEALDALILSLLRKDPLARPGSAAEVIAKLNAIAGLPAEGERDEQLIAQSFLAHPRFAGRAGELAVFQRLLAEVTSEVTGDGTARSRTLRVRSVAGMGRTRFLEELSLKGRLEGAFSLGVDASLHQEPRGVRITPPASWWWWPSG